MIPETVLEKIYEISFGKQGRFFKRGEYSAGYWISPSGVVSRVDSRHIDEICNNPEKFGISLNMIKKIYKKYKEGVGSEGKAREEIVLRLINSGWIRIRQYHQSRSMPWSVNFNKATENTLSRIYDFFEKLVEDTKPGYPDDRVWIDSPNFSGWYWVAEIMKFSLWKDAGLYESFKKKKSCLIFEIKK